MTLPGLTWWETLSSSVGNFIVLAPFILGAALLNTERGHRDLLRAFVLAALLYSVPILAEIRLSPFLLKSFYKVENGYFLQQIRAGGFRAMVFLGHGLLIATFCGMALIAAIGLWRMKQRMFSIPMGVIACYLLIVLILNKTWGVIFLILPILSTFIMFSSRKYLSLVCGVAAIIVLYPMIRGSDALPLRPFTELVRSVSPERAQSFEFRLDNEELLLDRAGQRPWFGWGRFGRSRVIVVTYWGATQDISVTDGAWIVTIGVSGWTGYIACFGLLTYPFFQAYRLRRLPLPMASLTLVAMLLLNVLDLIPNSALRPITWLIAGALAGMTVASMRPQMSASR